MSKIFYFILLSLLLISCKQEGKFIIKKGIKTATGKETVHLAHKKITAKSIVHSFGIDKKFVKNFKKLNAQELEYLNTDLKEFPVFKDIFVKNPSLVDSYKVVANNKAIRTEIKYLKDIQQQMLYGSNKKPEIMLLFNKNKDKAGTIFRDVPFVTKLIKHKKYNLKGVFPDFSKFRVFEFKLKHKHYLANDNTQFKLAKNALYEAYLSNPKRMESLLKKVNGNVSHKLKGKMYEGEELLQKQITDIKNPKNDRIFGLVWHHSEREGVLELIEYNVHKEVKHIGGKAVWGGGRSHR